MTGLTTFSFFLTDRSAACNGQYYYPVGPKNPGGGKCICLNGGVQPKCNIMPPQQQQQLSQITDYNNPGQGGAYGGNYGGKHYVHVHTSEKIIIVCLL